MGKGSNKPKSGEPKRGFMAIFRKKKVDKEVSPPVNQERSDLLMFAPLTALLEETAVQLGQAQQTHSALKQELNEIQGVRAQIKEEKEQSEKEIHEVKEMKKEIEEFKKTIPVFLWPFIFKNPPNSFPNK